MRRADVTAILLAVGCSTPAAQPRFANAPVTAVVDDRRDVPVPPEKRRIVTLLYHYDGSFHRRATRAMELHPGRRSLGVNALDEVPDSTWFTNRIGVRDLSPDEVRTGPSGTEGPELHKPWKIVSTKAIGVAVGIIVADARGFRYLVKFDKRGFAEVETGAHVVANRLLWSFGYNVPDDRIVHVRREDLVLTPESIRYDLIGNERTFSASDLEKILDGVEVERDGRIRVLASRMLEGTALGGHPAEGVRADDPNDRIPHELRRDLRGARVPFAWLDHLDIKDDNSLDMWVADRADPKRHYVEHYWLDFGSALGAMGTLEEDPRRGHEYVFDPVEVFGSFIFFGSRPHSWDAGDPPPLRGVGAFTADGFDPARWKPYTPAYVPLGKTDRVDWFWGAKTIARFTPAQLRAAVEAAAYTDPRAVEYLTRVLIGRQRAIAAYGFSRVNPVDRFTFERDRLCFDDLMLVHQIVGAADTRYALRTLDRAGRPLGGQHTVAAASSGRSCSAPLALARTGEGYTIVEIVTQRGASAHTASVHLARDPKTGVWRVIGVWRD
jgi:hypothetical protein